MPEPPSALVRKLERDYGDNLYRVCYTGDWRGYTVFEPLFYETPKTGKLEAYLVRDGRYCTP